jgi:hypothetical protein
VVSSSTCVYIQDPELAAVSVSVLEVDVPVELVIAIRVASAPVAALALSRLCRSPVALDLGETSAVHWVEPDAIDGPKSD